ncbi:MAG: RagB/SusD family nutrient uptake outer membrane protein, partial [Muribaculaceae bacterium]|nr:RagB/SusD family nutrient uptake outer membrane protein [Muribaculaceae bacterium]
ELAMEGHRWFDLVRWGIAAQIMDKDNGSYGKNESAEARAEMASFIPGKHELFPLPTEELVLNPMEQNPGY